MPFIPHTKEETDEMLGTIGAKSIEELFDEIPESLPRAQFEHVPPGLSELEVSRLMQERAPENILGGCFIGAGAYEHHIPAAVWEVATRGEFYTAYTPYQAEASQGSLQLIYEYQSMMTQLMGMEVSNASLYDGATALAESALMAVRIKKHKAKRIIVPRNIHPVYRKVLKSVLKHQDIILEELSFDSKTGQTDYAALSKTSGDGLAAVVISQPNFFGSIEEVDQLTNLVHELGALVIAAVNPTAIALLKPPGQWGEQGADIVCGEGQPLGIPLAGGGPYFGFMCCNKKNVRQLPGRIVGRTHDTKGRVGYTLTLQAREQHIRRAKATSNICTNQGLMVTAATIYMSLLGANGLRQVAMNSHHNAKTLCERLAEIKGVEHVFTTPFFHEFVIRLNTSTDKVLPLLSEQGIQAGYALKSHYPELGECLLVCTTETKTLKDLQRYEHLLSNALNQSS